jgi:riboflavin biosynthesis pyrimidine reductase
MQVDLNALSAKDVAELYRPPLARWVRSNMVISLDGNYAGEQGSSRELSSAGDLRVLLLLRALSDVVVVGARTAIGEKYANLAIGEDLLEVANKTPRLCVVSRSLAFSGNEGFLKDGNVRPLIITARQNEPSWVDKLSALQQVADVIVSDSTVTGPFIIESLRSTGHNQILCEGGPSLLALLAQDNCLDEMSVTLAPLVIGQTPVKPPLGHTYSTWHRTFVGVADEHTFFRFTATPLHTQV